MVFAHTLKALLAQVFERRHLLTPEVVAELRELGVEVGAPGDLLIERWWKVVALAARLLAPEVGDGDPHFAVGCEMTRGFEASVIGRSLFLMLRLLGTRRALLRIADHYKTADSVTRILARERSPTSVEVTFEARAEGPITSTASWA